MKEFENREDLKTNDAVAEAPFSVSDHKFSSLRPAQADGSALVQDGTLPSLSVSSDVRPPGDRSSGSGISPNDIQQGGIGDCYFLASLADLAKQHPEQISKMIQKNDDGSFTVTFPGDPQHPQRVTLPAENYKVASGHNYAQGAEWVRVMELAHRRYTGKFVHDESGQEPIAEAQWKTEKGGDPAGAIKLLTGRDSDTTYSNDFDPRTLARVIDTDLRNGKLIVASTDDKVSCPESCQPQTKIHGGHAYSVIGMETKGRVILRNPHGGVDAQISMTVEDFQKTFKYVSREK